MSSERNFLKAGIAARTSVEFGSQILLTWRTAAHKLAQAEAQDGNLDASHEANTLDELLDAVRSLAEPLQLQLLPLPWEVFLPLAISVSAHDKDEEFRPAAVTAAYEEILARRAVGNVVVPPIDPARIESVAGNAISRSASVWKTAAAQNFNPETLSAERIEALRQVYLRCADTIDAFAPMLPQEVFDAIVEQYPDDGFPELNLNDFDPAPVRLRVVRLPPGTTLEEVEAAGKSRPQTLGDFLQRLLPRFLRWW